MSPMQEQEFVQQIANKIGHLGYHVMPEPTKIPHRKIWHHDLPSIFRGPRYKADLLVEQGQDYLLVEAKTRPFLMGGVIQARNLSDYYDVPVVICVPDRIEKDIPNSVLRFASESSVTVSPLSDMATALKTAFANAPQ